MINFVLLTFRGTEWAAKKWKLAVTDVYGNERKKVNSLDFH